MYVGKTLFAQVMEFVPWTSFARIVQRHGGNAGVRTLSCAEQFRAMAFAQLTWRESLRDIEASLSANASKLQRCGHSIDCPQPLQFFLDATNSALRRDVFN